jgi:hypothetical protein
MRTITTAIMLVLLASLPARAGVPEIVAVGVDTGNITGKVATEIQDGITGHILNGLSEVLSNIVRAKVQLIPVTDPNIIGKIRNCDSTTCLQELAQSTSVADLVVRVKVQAKKSPKKGKPDYVISVGAARALPDADTWFEKSECNDCGSPEIKHMASLLAGAIAEQMKIRVSPPKATPAPAPLPPVVVEKPTPPPALLVKSPPPAPKNDEWYVPHYLSVPVLVGGVALIGTGLYLRHLDGQSRCDLTPPQKQCSEIRESKGVGTGLIVGGGIAAAAGFVGLVFFGPPTASSRVAVGFTSSSILVRGAF